MTIEPGYYWIRWPDADERGPREWGIALVGGRTAYTMDFGTRSMTGAELGPRIEPPEVT